MKVLPLIQQFCETRIKPELVEGKTFDIEMIYKKANRLEDRGYYLSVREVEKEGSFVCYVLMKSPLLQVQLNSVKRKSAKAEEEAFSILETLVNSDSLKTALENAGFTC